MKKTFFYLLTTLLTSTILSSCLGDTKSTIEGQKSFAVIDVVEGIKVAKIAVGTNRGFQLSSEQIDVYNRGDVMLLDYKFNPQSYINEQGVIKADLAKPSSENDIFRNSEHASVQIASTDTLPINNIAFKSIGMPPAYTPNRFFLDKWLFSYSAKITKEQAMDMELIYDETKQVDKNGKPLPKNNFIIDIKLKVTGTPNVGSETLTKEGKKVVNFSLFRSFLDSKIENLTGDKIKIAYIWFRYYQDGDTSRPTYRSSIGSLQYESEN